MLAVSLCVAAMPIVSAQIPIDPYSAIKLTKGAINAASAASSGAKKSKQAKLLDAHTTYKNVDGISIPATRIPSNEIKSPAKSHIISTQNQLEIYSQCYSNQSRLPMSSIALIQEAITAIKKIDANWLCHNYEMELSAYLAYDSRLQQAEQERQAAIKKREAEQSRRRNDSIERVKNDLKIAEQRKYQQQQDSIRYQRELTLIREKRVSDSISASKAAYPIAPTQPATSTTPNLEYKSSSGGSSGGSYNSGGHSYQTGPRGGQYYINSHGNKTYKKRRR